MKLFRRSLRMSSMLSTCKTCLCCVLRLVAWIPVLFVILLMLWGYYVYVYIVHISGSFPLASGSPALSMIVVVFFLLSAHVILFLQLTSYIRTIFTRHKVIPEQFQLSQDQLEQLDEAEDEQVMLRTFGSDLPVHELSRGGGVRYCDICEVIKPDRCHHCSVCNRCVLKMDHHCPWVNNCVGYSNYKFFLLFLFYSVLLCVWLCITGLNAFVIAWGTNKELKSAAKFQVIIWYFICSMFGLSTAVLLCFHVYLTLFNKTTLENMQPPNVDNSRSNVPYFISFRRNIQQVMGRNCFLAFIPIFSSEGDGMIYCMARHRNLDMSDDGEFENSETQLLAQTQL